MGAAFRRRDRLDRAPLRPCARASLYMQAGRAAAGRRHRSAAACRRCRRPRCARPRLRSTERPSAWMASQVRAPPIARLLLDRGAVLARRGQRDGRRCRPRAPSPSMAQARTPLVPTSMPRNKRRHVAARIGAGAGSFRPRQPAREGGALGRGQMQAMLGAAVEDVLRASAPIRCGAGSAPRAHRTWRRNAGRDRPGSSRLPAARRRGCRRAGRNAARDRRGSQGNCLRKAASQASKSAPACRRRAAARARSRPSPCREERLQLVERMLRQLAIGGDLAAEDREERRRRAVGSLGSMSKM